MDSATRFVGWAHHKELAAALKPLHTAENEERALQVLETLEAKYAMRFPSVMRTFRIRRCTEALLGELGERLGQIPSRQLAGGQCADDLTAVEGDGLGPVLR